MWLGLVGTWVCSAHAGQWAVGGGYFGETLLHPGALGVLENRLGPDDGTRPLLAVDLGTYWHPRATVGLFLDARGGWRVPVSRRYDIDLTAGVGYLHSFVAAETVNFANTGRPGLMPLIDLGFFGWRLSPERPDSLRVASSLRLFWRYPVNNHLALHPAVTVTLTRPL